MIIQAMECSQVWSLLSVGEPRFTSASGIMEAMLQHV